MINIKTEISYQDYTFIEENRDESIPENEFKVMVLEQFICWELFDELIQRGICPECGGELESVLVDYEPYEFWGSVVHEPIYISRCTDCGKTYDD